MNITATTASRTTSAGATPFVATTAIAAIALVLAFGRATPAEASETFAVRAGTIVTGTGEPIEDGYLLVRDGAIASVSTKAPPAGVPVLDRRDAVIAPGFVDLGNPAGVRGHVDDTARAVQPELEIADALDPLHEDLERAADDGTTTVVLVPSARNVVGGSAAAVKTGGPWSSRPVTLDPAPMVLSVGRAVESPRFRVPSSRMGTYDLFRRTMTEARNRGAGKLAEVASGRLPGIVHADDDADLSFLASEIAKHDLELAVALTGMIEDETIETLPARMPIVLGPFTHRTSPRMLRLPAKLAEAGHRIALRGFGPASQRLTVALAVRHGLPKDDALAAVTSVPAGLAGLSNRVGALATGMDADFLVLSGDPISPFTQVREVWIGGRAAAKPVPESTAHATSRND